MPDAMIPTEAPPRAQRMATTTAWTSLRDALAAEALADPDAFDRLTGFRAAVIRLAKRYEAGEPPHTARSAKVA